MIFPAEKINEILRSAFGFTSFLPGQKEILSDICAGRNVVAVMPTGGGKSLLYQLPSILFDGVAVVISPLISLMKDQVDALVKKGIKATFINSSLTYEEKAERVTGIRKNYWDIIYIAPERIKDRNFMAVLKEQNVSLLAVDEAHCISQWGHDFRPDYLAISELRSALKNPVTIALTATATREVRRDIAKHLELPDWEDHVKGFDRENLFFRVTEVSGRNEKFREIRKCLEQMKGPGIIYAATRKNVKLIADTLRMDNVPVLTYHGGMSDKERVISQERFMNDDIPVVTATNAFGMGIDKRDIRFVVHFDIPGSLEAYYQEVGRAGRDGKRSLCHLLFSYADVRIQEFFIKESNPESAVVRMVQGVFENERHPGLIIPDISSIKVVGSNMAEESILHMFEKAGMIDRLPGKGMYCFTENTGYGKILEELIRNSRLKRENDEVKLGKMVKYAYHKRCRRNWILDYFGDAHEYPRCRACDNCIKNVDLRPVRGDDLETAKKVLKGVSSLRGRFGANKAAQFLSGSKASWIRDFNYYHLETYGLLKGLTRERISSVISALVEAGYLYVRLKDGKFPMVNSTDKGREVVKGTSECRMKFPEEKIKKEKLKRNVQNRKETIAAKNYSPELFEKLRAERFVVSIEKKIKPYAVFHDSALKAMAAVCPETLEEMLTIKGVGEVTLKKYGERFLRIINREH